ncbi:O-antigen ligase family protein [Methylobacter sp.]|uniref:O-antigen ligase family protein n=1 Tax=Methylobacter sp. TaxID=2051955 RepID=UPI003DA6AE23
MENQIQDASNLNPTALGLLLVLVCLTLALPRRHAFSPVLIMVGLVPMGQQIVIFGLHFHLFRILLLSGILRVIIRGEAAQLKSTGMDVLFTVWIVVTIVFGTLSKPSTELFVNRLGDAYNAFGCYFFVRCVIVTFEDAVASVRILAFISLPVAALMLVEKVTSHNLLSVLGGVPEITAIRDGHLRCQGAFRHPIMAGIFGATQFPLYFALWQYSPRNRLLAFIAMIASFIIVVSASSSGALMGAATGIVGLVLWKWRKSMRLIRWGALVAILCLAIVMKAPVWYLLAKLSNVMGGGGWHRAWLIDQALAHFDEWWLFGTTYTAHWGPGGLVIATDPNMMDITNHYIMEGVKGGALKLGLFIAIIVNCFRRIGRRLRIEAPNSPEEFFIWAIGVSFFSHCLSFISANYFDQVIVIWYWLQAIICNIGSASPKPIGNAPYPSTTRTRTWRYSLPRSVSVPPSSFTR